VLTDTVLNLLTLPVSWHLLILCMQEFYVSKHLLIVVLLC